MTMEPIRIPGLHWNTDRARTAAKMTGSRRAGVSGRMFANHTESAMERPAIRGLACVYNEVFQHEGELHAFLPGCFTAALARQGATEIRVDHDEDNVLADRYSGLRFLDTEAGLAFEYEPAKDMRGATLISLVASSNRSDISVGVRDLTTVVKNIRGHDVRLITEVGTLLEISLCREGAVKRAHARVVDLAVASSLEDEAASGAMLTVGLANDLAQNVKRLAATVEAMAAAAAPQSYLVHHQWD